jgi:hypothetical protein
MTLSKHFLHQRDQKKTMDVSKQSTLDRVLGIHCISADDYFLQEASYRRLYGLLKQQLIRLYQLVDSMEEPQDLTKAQLAQGIVDARADDITLPPSSPPGPSCSGSSDYSDDDDDGNAAGDESPTRPSPLRRHATAGNIGQFSSTTTRRSKSPLKSRSASMNLYASSDSLPQASSSKRPAPAIENTQPTRRVIGPGYCDPP